MTWPGDGKLRDPNRDRKGGSQGKRHKKTSSIPEVGQKEDPSKADPSKPGLNILVRIRMDTQVQVEMPKQRPQREEDMPKGAYIKRRRFEKFGYTEDCEGCRRLRSGVMPRRPHLESCSKRIYEEVSKTEEGRKEVDGGEGKY